MEESPDKHETPLHSDLDEARLLALRQEFTEASSSPSFVHTLLYAGEHGETLAVFLNQNRFPARVFLLCLAELSRDVEGEDKFYKMKNLQKDNMIPMTFTLKATKPL